MGVRKTRLGLKLGGRTAKKRAVVGASRKGRKLRRKDWRGVVESVRGLLGGMKENEGTYTKEKRADLKATRASAKAARIQEARERSGRDCGASPILPGRAGTEEPFESGELTPVVVENEGTKMNDDIKKLMATINEKLDKLDKLPTGEQFSSFNAKIEQNAAMAESNAKRIADQERNIEKISTSISRIEQEMIESRRSLSGKIRTEIGNNTTQTSGHEEDIEFTRARRSFRMWPVRDDGKGLEEAIKAFIIGALDVDDYDAKIGGIVSCRSVGGREEGVVYDEVVAEFRNPQIRDYIAARGPKMASYVDSDRKPTCGIRMEVPAHLLPNFKLLKRYGFCLRRREGNLKSHVKFDDYKKNLFMQVRFSGEGEEWLNIYPDEAHEAMRKMDTKKSVRLRSLNSPPPSETRTKQPRSASESEYPERRWQPDPRGGGVEVMETERTSWKPPQRNTR